MAAASSSSSATTQVKKYDVFLSFRGEDTRNNFTSHLHAALCRKKIKTFIDNQLIKGDEIPSSLLSTIKASKVSVIIFSKNYASSRWCLQELEQIFECKNKYEQIVIPVFYHVDPSHVRNQTETFWNGFANLEDRFKENSEVLQRWRTALKEAANLSGWHINDEKPESILIEETVRDILKRLNKLSPCDNKDLVGVECAIKTVESLLHIGSNDVCIVGIWGIGGIGKTTITHAVFDKILNHFEGSYFFENIREESENNRLTHLRIEFLSTILEDAHTNIGFEFTKERLGRMKLLIVFDDITYLEQIEKLIGDLKCLGSGSRVLITTRDKHVLKNCGVNDANIYKVGGLWGDDAHRLFQQYAFRQNHPIKEYMELSNKIVAYTKGLPLALKVLGSSLFSKGKQFWESAINKLEKGPPSGIQKVLKVSYDGLDKEEKDIFLNIACFFKWEDVNSVIEILNACDISAEQGISVLIDKCLITMSGNIITMHDLLEEMGTNIAREENSRNDPNKHIRLWHHKDAYKVLTKNMGIEAVRSLSLDVSEIGNAGLDCHGLVKMHNLRFFRLYNSQDQDNYEQKLDGFEDLESFSTEITYFGWHAYPFKSLPLNFHTENLVRLDMRCSKVKQLWNGVQNLVKLKYINLSHSKHITEIPNLSSALKLQELILDGCTSFLGIALSSTRNLNELVKLNLRDCTRLISIPDGIQSKSIILRGCSNLKIAPKISCRVEKLDLSGTAIKESPFIEHPSRLVRLDLSNCSRLESLSSSICKLKFLKYLSLEDSSKLETLPNNFGDLEALEKLETNGIVITNVPSSILHLNKINYLSLSRPFGQVEPMNWVLNSSSGSRSLKYLRLDNCQMTGLPDNLGKLSFLKQLHLCGNNFESMPENIKDLSNLRYLDISDCERLQSLPELPRGLNVVACDCSSLESISDSSFLFSPYSRPQAADFANCFKLDLRKVLHKEFRHALRAGICFPGTEIPEWFSFQNAGSCITLEQSQDWHNKSFLGFYISAVIFPEYRVDHRYNVVNFYCFNISKDGKIEVYRDSIEPYFDGRRSYYPSYLRSNHVLLGFHPRIGRPFKVLESLDEEYEVNMNKMMNSKIFIEFHAHGAKVKKCGIHFVFAEDCGEPSEGSRRSVDSDEDKDESRSIKIKISNSFEDESSLRPQVMSKFRGNLLSQSWKLKMNALRDVMKNALLNVQQNTILWSEVEEMTCENPKGYICFPGCEIPNWFNIQNAGDYVELPRGSFNHKFVGLAFCIVVAFQVYDDEISQDFLVNCELHLKCKDGFNKVAIGSMRGWFEGDKPPFIKSYNIFVGYDFDMYTHEFRELSYNSEAIIKFYVTTYGYGVPNLKFVDGCKVKNCGVRLLYTQDFEKQTEESNEDKEAEEPHWKRLGFSNYVEGKSSSRYGMQQVYEREVEAFNRRINQSREFSSQDLNEFPQNFDRSTSNVRTNKQSFSDYDEAKPNGSGCYIDEPQTFFTSATCGMQSNNFNFLDLSEFPQDFVGSKMDVTFATKRSFTDNGGADSSGSGYYDNEGEPEPKRLKEIKFF